MATATKPRQTITLRPLDNRVVVQRDEDEERTPGGIVLPDKAKQKTKRGKVTFVGPGKLNKDGQRIPTQVKVGDHILFSKFGGDEFEVDEQELLLIREDDILAIIAD